MKKRLLIGFLFLALAGVAPIAPVFVPKAEACTPVTPCNLTTIDFPAIARAALEQAAVLAAQQAIQSMTHSIVNWINSGFDGSPGFATNLGINLRQVADGAALNFINGLQKQGAINSPYMSQVIGAIRVGYLLYSSPDALRQRLQYDLNQYSPNDAAFRAGRFNQGGFTAWMAMTYRCGNDPYCAQFAAQDELNKTIDSAVSQTMTELGWGNGFFSWRGNCRDSQGNSVELSDATKDDKCEIRTPGSVVGDMVTSATHEPQLGLAVATSIQQVIGALANQLISGVLGQNGLLSGGSSSSGNNYRSAIEQSGSTGALGSTLSSNFIQASQSEKDTVGLYIRDWQIIHDAAARAEQACALLGDSAMRTEVTDVVAQSNAAIAKGGTANTALDSIITRATQAQSLTGTQQSALVEQVTNDYQCLIAGGAPDGTGACAHSATTPIGTTCPVSPQILPNASEISCIVAQSANDDGTLLKHLNQIADNFCH